MKATQLLLVAGAAAAAYWLSRNYGQGASKSQAVSDNSPVVHLVDETLHKHEGEDNVMVHAFEAALEQKTKHENQPA